MPASCFICLFFSLAILYFQVLCEHLQSIWMMFMQHKRYGSKFIFDVDIHLFQYYDYFFLFYNLNLTSGLFYFIKKKEVSHILLEACPLI